MRWDTAPLQYVTQIDPSKSEVSGVPDDTLVSFLPMDAVGFGMVFEPPEDRPLGEIRSGYTYLADGDVAFAKISPSFQNGKSGRAEDLTNGIAMATTELTVLRPQPNVDGRFLQYVLRSDDFLCRGAETMHGVAGQQRVSSGFVAGYALALPPLEVQRRIADFLDTETARIDTLIATNHHATTLLDERHTSSCAKALWERASSPLHDRDGLSKIQYVTTHRTGGRTPARGQVRYWDQAKTEGLRWAAIGDLTASEDGLIADTAEYVTQAAVAELPMAVVPPGALLYAMYASLGKTVRVGEPLTHNQAIIALHPSPRVHVDYLFEWLRFLEPYVLTEARSNTQANLNAEQVGQLPIPAPPMHVQVEIVERIRSSGAQAKVARMKLERQSDLLVERRQALITAAVTGEIEV